MGWGEWKSKIRLVYYALSTLLSLKETITYSTITVNGQDSEKGWASWRREMCNPRDDASMKLTEPTA